MFFSVPYGKTCFLKHRRVIILLILRVINGHLKPGNWSPHPADLGKNLCDRNGKPASRDAVNRMLDFFVRDGMISIAGERHKGTVITITNYSDYAQNMDNLPAHNNAHTPAHDEASNSKASGGGAAHGGAHTSAHHEQDILNTNVFNDRPRKSKSSPRKAKPEAEVSSPKGDKWGTADDLKAAEWIYSKIQIVCPTAAEPAWHNWANDIRLMRQIDGRTHEEICRLFQWANKDPFWCSNVLCPAKLREKWPTLAIQSQQPGRAQRVATPDQPVDWNTAESWEGFL
ncbi:replication protein [Morganella morganii]|uniref:replication protein n=1 Tax=Morganella morganii TaxID=582 RepID=UPI003D6F78EC